jgi:anti-sigma factor RsiW
MSEQERQPRRSEELLHRFLDDALSIEEQAELDRYLADDPELVEARNEMSEMSTMLRTHMNEEVDAVDFSQFYAGIEARIGEEAAPTPAIESAPVAAQAEPGFFDQVREWFSEHWGPVMAGAAAAAAVAFFVTGADDSKVDPNTAGGTVVVDAISNEGNKTILVSMPSQEGESTVIWLLDNEDDDQSPIEGEDPI